MQAKNFFMFSLIVVAVVSVITSLIGISLFQEPVLLSDTAGQVEIVGGLSLGTIDVILVDSTIKTNILDSVKFTGVLRGDTVATDLDDMTPVPYPFVIENTGQATADVEIYADANLFDYKHNSGGSTLKFKIEEPVADLFQYSHQDYQDYVKDCLADDGAPVTSCYGYAMESWTDLPTTIESSVLAINDLNHYLDHDKALIHLQIYIHDDEPGGVKAANLYVVGVESTIYS